MRYGKASPSTCGGRAVAVLRGDALGIMGAGEAPSAELPWALPTILPRIAFERGGGGERGMRGWVRGWIEGYMRRG